MQRAGPAGPVNLLLFSFKNNNLVNRDICPGILPVKPLLCICKDVNGVNADIWEGIVEINLFVNNDSEVSEVSFVKQLSQADKVPLI